MVTDQVSWVSSGIVARTTSCSVAKDMRPRNFLGINGQYLQTFAARLRIFRFCCVSAQRVTNSCL